MVAGVTFKFPDQHLPVEEREKSENRDHRQPELQLIGFTGEAVTISHHAYLYLFRT